MRRGAVSTYYNRNAEVYLTGIGLTIKNIHEDVTNKIGKDLVKLMDPKYLEVVGLFYPRGNISIHPTFTYSNGEEKYDKIEEHRFINRNLNPTRQG
jgi:hypothetical protein